jgi:hypothetical protein
MTRAVRLGSIWLAQAAILLLLLGCPSIPSFDPTSYQNAVQLKFETLALIDKSGDKFSVHQNEVAALTAKYDGALETASKVQTNEAVIQAWQVIRGAQTGSAGEFFQTWKQRGTLRPVIRAEKKAQIGRHFDYVICLEAAKSGGPACTNPLASSPTAPPAPATERPAGGQQ